MQPRDQAADVATAFGGSDRLTGQRLVEREAEVAKLSALLDEARAGRGRTVIIRGPPGIGKTRLLGELQRFDTDPATATFSAIGTELERDFPFGCVRQLFEPLVRHSPDREREELFGGDARHAEAVFQAPSANAEPLPDPGFGILHGLYWLTANLAERSPLLIVLDDAHWADPPSLRFMSFLGHRLDGVPALVVLTMRPAEPGADVDLVRDLARHPSAEVIDLGPLSEDAVAEIMRTRLDGGVTERLYLRCHEATGGNPFLLGELLREFERAPEAVTEQGPERIGPERVAEDVTARLEQVGAAAPNVARAVAVLGERADLPTAAGLAELDADTAAGVADELAHLGILEPGRPLRFVHPIVRNAVYGQMESAERDRWHRRAASVLSASGVPEEAVTVHLLATEPGGRSEVVELLWQAARVASARGASDAAVHYLERALAEPPAAASLHAEILMELGRNASLLGDPRALDWLREAVELAGDPSARVQASIGLVMALTFADRAEEALAVGRRALAESGIESSQARRLAGWLLTMAQISPSTRRPVLGLAHRNCDAALAGEALSAAQLADAAIECAMSDGDARQTGRLARRAVETGLIDEVGSDDPKVQFAAGALVVAEQFGAVDRLLADAIADSRSLGSVRSYAANLVFRAWVRYREGRLAEVMADAELYPDFSEPTVTDLVLAGPQIQALIDTAEVDRAAEIAASIAASPLDRTLTVYQRFAEGLAALRLRQGDPRGALEVAEGVAAWEEGTKQHNGTWVAWRSQAALAHSALGEHDRAGELAEEQVSLARRFGAPGMLGAALRVLGIVQGGKEGIAALREANEELARSALRLEHARGMIDLGAALRRANRRTAAREMLQEGLDLAQRCGADAVAGIAIDELVASGARPRRAATGNADALTPSERRVAEMAAEGMSNKEIAQALFVTANTVHTHLRHVYQKLEIGSRAQLAGRLTRPG